MNHIYYFVFTKATEQIIILNSKIICISHLRYGEFADSHSLFSMTFNLNLEWALQNKINVEH